MLIDLLLLSAISLSGHLSWKLYRDIFTPLCVYVSTWCTCLLLFRLRFVEYGTLELKTALLFGAGIVSFCLGCAACKENVKKARIDTQVFISLPWLQVAILVLLVLDVVGFALFAARMSDVYGLQTYFTDPAIIRADAREWTKAGAIGALILLCYPLFISSLIHILEARRLSLLAVIGIVVPVAETYLLTDRLTLIIFMTSSFFIWIYHTRRRTFDRKVVYFLGGGLLCILVYFLAVGGFYRRLVTPASTSFRYSSIDSNSQIGIRLLDPYIYVTGSFPTFQAAMNDVDHLSWGTQTFYPLARLLYAMDIIERRPEASDFTFYFVPIPFNTYTWLYSFYSDFGICGVLLLPALVGWLQTKLYVRMKETPTVFSLAGSSALAAATAFTAFGFIQYDFMLWSFIAVMFLVSKRTCITRSRRPRSTALRLEDACAVRPA
jgi:oligosaccharide repeat unit polymerase